MLRNIFIECFGSILGKLLVTIAILMINIFITFQLLNPIISVSNQSTDHYYMLIARPTLSLIP